MQRVVFHVPHDGTIKPQELMNSICVSKELFNYYEEKMRDKDVRLMIPDGYESVCFEVCRLLCDVERFADGTEPMEKLGMGFCYEKVFDGTQIKQISPEIINRTMKYYSFHHDRLDNIARTSSHGLFIIDLHSFSKDIVVLPATNREYPDICLGFDAKYCKESTVGAIVALCEKFGYSTSLNTPYSGSFIPNTVFRNSNLSCYSVMVEINKNVYIHNGVTNPDSVNDLRCLLAEIADSVR